MCSAHILATRELYLIFIRMLRTFRIEPPPSADPATYRSDPCADMKNPRDLIMATKPYNVLCIPRNEEALRRALEAAAEADM